MRISQRSLPSARTFATKPSLLPGLDTPVAPTRSVPANDPPTIRPVGEGASDVITAHSVASNTSCHLLLAVFVSSATIAALGSPWRSIDAAFGSAAVAVDQWPETASPTTSAVAVSAIGPAAPGICVDHSDSAP